MLGDQNSSPKKKWVKMSLINTKHPFINLLSGKDNAILFNTGGSAAGMDAFWNNESWNQFYDGIMWTMITIWALIIDIIEFTQKKEKYFLFLKGRRVIRYKDLMNRTSLTLQFLSFYLFIKTNTKLQNSIFGIYLEGAYKRNNLYI